MTCPIKRYYYTAQHTALSEYLPSSALALIEILNINNYSDRITAKHQWPSAPGWAGAILGRQRGGGAYYLTKEDQVLSGQVVLGTA